LQTHQPEHPVMRALIAQDRDAFYAAEIDARERRIIRRSAGSRASSSPGADRHETAGYARALARAAPQVLEPEVLEPDLLARLTPRRLMSHRLKPCACSVPPTRRCLWCAAAIGCVCWSKRRALSISRLICANGSRRAEETRRHQARRIDVDPQSFL
jgi:hypothetical protein